MVKLEWRNSAKLEWPQARAKTCIKDTLAPKKRANLSALTCTSSFLRNSGFWVAIPAGQLFELHILAATQPTACIAEFDSAIASAPNAIAFAKSSATRKPPVITKVTSRPAFASK